MVVAGVDVDHFHHACRYRHWWRRQVLWCLPIVEFLRLAVLRRANPKSRLDWADRARASTPHVKNFSTTHHDRRPATLSRIYVHVTTSVPPSEVEY
jgi:hypothetical protein